MLFGKRPRKVQRILIVEDEPLIAFDNEYFLKSAGYDVVAAVDGVPAAVAYIGEHELDLVLADVRLSDGGSGRDVADAAKGKDVPLVFVTGSAPADASTMALGVLAKPYTQRDLLSAIEAVDAHLSGKTPKKLPGSFVLFD